MSALANRGGDVVTPIPAKVTDIQSAIVECARAICPRKTWGYVANLLCLSEDTAKNRLEGRRAFTADELATLLRTERGLDYLVAVMGEAEPGWWRAFKAHLAVGEALKMQRAARRRLKEAVNADRELAASLARAEAALAVRDEDFHRPDIGGLGEVGRALDRAVAPGAKRGRS